MRRNRMLDVVAKILTLAAITASNGWAFTPGDYKPGGKEFPRINPTPLSVFVVHGTLDPALQIEFDAIYGATNKSCMYSPYE